MDVSEIPRRLTSAIHRHCPRGEGQEQQRCKVDHARYLTSLIPLSAFIYNTFLLITLLHYSTLPSLKIWSWPTTFIRENSSETYPSMLWFMGTPEIVLQIVTLLVALYLFAACVVCAVGFGGVLKKHVSTIRFFRDCAIADLSFSVVLTFMLGYSAFFYQQLGVGVTACEELSRKPVIMRQLGIDAENCEQWVERSMLASIIGMVVLVVIRLHAVLLIAKYHKHVCQAAERASGVLPYSVYDLEERKVHHHHHRRHSSFSSGQKVYLLPHAADSALTTPTHDDDQDDDDMITVYAPTRINITAAKNLSSGMLREAWVGSRRRHHHRHHHRKNSSRSSLIAKDDTWVDSAEEDEGQIALPVYPGEGLSK